MGESKQFKEYEGRVESINRIEPEMELLDDAELRSEADELRKRAREGESLDDLLPEAFALVREAGKRAIGHRRLHVQPSRGGGLALGPVTGGERRGGTTPCSAPPGCPTH